MSNPGCAVCGSPQWDAEMNGTTCDACHATDTSEARRQRARSAEQRSRALERAEIKAEVLACRARLEGAEPMSDPLVNANRAGGMATYDLILYLLEAREKESKQ